MTFPANSSILLLDTETGGNDALKYSLLTVFAALVNPNSLEIEFMHHWRIKSDEDFYQVSAEGMRINQIDLSKHHEMGVSPKQFKEEFANLIWKAKTAFSPPSKLTRETKIQVLGHNVHYDIESLSTILGRDYLNGVLSYRLLDTATIALFMQKIGRLPPNESISLSNLARLLEIEVKNAHDAQADALVTLEVFKKFCKLIEVPKLTVP